MTEQKILEAIVECGYLTEMDDSPYVAFYEDEDGDTRFLDDGSFVIYNIKTNLKASDIQSVYCSEADTGVPYINITLINGDELLLCAIQKSFWFEADYESFKQELIEKYGGMEFSFKGNMTEEEVLNKIEECSSITEMDFMPYVAYVEYEDGDTRFDESGYLIIYDIKTSLRAEDFLAIRYKDNDDFCRDPYVAFYLTENRYLELKCVPGEMGTADYESFKNELKEKYNMG
ncbi:MAG: hypothetical protein IKU54_02905 [Oscillospiraceae bacterium]|nr:hypothetical protein [Oscillospiraceae bacterium]